MTMTPDAPPALDAAGLTHRYGAVAALDRVSLTVASGEFLTILGPSGSGKTTLLRVIGGFETPDAADRLDIAGIDVRGLPPNHREVATVFQHYALFPHMSVGENVEYGLKVRGVAPAERLRRAGEALALVRLADKADRRIQQLSGGERQRVAFARALATRPRILLLDEPMGALDERLRRDMEIEVRQLQQTLGATFIQVTHSQEEALVMSDRIAVMNRGRIEQLGSPGDIFERPRTRFVAAFMGMANLFDGAIGEVANGLVRVDCAGGAIWARWTGGEAPVVGEAAFAAAHPRKIRLDPAPDADGPANVFDGAILGVAYRGADTELQIGSALGVLTAAIDGPAVRIGDFGPVGWRPVDMAAGPASVPA